MIGIIGAMEEEVAILKDKLTDMNEISVAHVKFYRGKLNSKEVVLTQSGIGKVNAAISTTLLIEKFNPKKPLKYKRDLEKFLSDHSEYKILHCHFRGTESTILKSAKKYGLTTIIMVMVLEKFLEII